MIDAKRKQMDGESDVSAFAFQFAEDPAARQRFVVQGESQWRCRGGTRMLVAMNLKQRTFDFDDDDRPENADVDPSLCQSETVRGSEQTSSANVIVNETRQKIRRIRPPVKAHGGKYYLARRIVPILQSAPGPVTEYLEPCAFGASVFLAMPRYEREILADVNPDIVNLWRVLSQPAAATSLAEMLSDVPYSEEQFREALQPVAAITGIEQAVRFIIRSRFSRGGLGKSFAWSERLRGGRPGDENSWKTFREQTLPQLIERATGVEVVADPCWWTVWESRHRIQRLIYADPPYASDTRTAPKAYGPFEMTHLHHFWLVSALKAHTGPAAISGYRNPDYDRWLHNWRRIDIDMPNNAGQTQKKQRRTESLWINW